MSASVIEFNGDKVARKARYFADLFEAPAWHAKMWSNGWTRNLEAREFAENGKTGNCCTLRRADGGHYSCCGFPVLQKPFLGTADSEHRNCLGVRSFLLEILEASMKP
jgi:hypothetical protein